MNADICQYAERNHYFT